MWAAPKAPRDADSCLLSCNPPPSDLSTAVSQPKLPVPSYTACFHAGTHRAAASCSCSSCGLLPPALGQWVQAEHHMTKVPEAQAQLLRLWGEKSCFCTSARIISGCQGGAVRMLPACHSHKVALSPRVQWNATLPQVQGSCSIQARQHPLPLLLCPRASPLKMSR